MGQYHVAACLDTKEFINPHKLGDGLKLGEQVESRGGVGSALIVLLAVSNGRGGGDLVESDLVGRWGGRRVVIIGDYAEPGDYVVQPGDPEPEALFGECSEAGSFRDITPDLAAYMGVALGYVYFGEGWVQRANLWEDVKGISTIVGDDEHGRLALVDGRYYPVGDIVSALTRMPFEARTCSPFTVEALGVKAVRR